MFKPIFLFETKKLLIKRYIALLLIVFFFLAAFIFDGKNSLNSIQKNKNVFQEIEKLKIKQYLTYTQYGGYGFRLLFIPSPLSALFNSQNITNGLMANIDAMEKLTLYNDSKGENLFVKSNDTIDFSKLLLFFGVLAGLYFGFDALRCTDYLKFLSWKSDIKKVIKNILISRLILFNLIFLLLVFLSILIIGDIISLNIFFWGFVFILPVIISLFILIGSFIGSIKNKLTSIISFSIVFIFLYFSIPWIINKIVNVNATFIHSNMKLELENLKLMMNFEKRAFEQIGFYKSKDIAPDNVKTLVNDYLKNEYKQFKESENKLKEDIFKNIKRYHFISSLFPTSFYYSVSKEVGGIGFNSFLDFYDYSLSLKFKFIDFYLEKKFNQKTEPGKIDSFIKKDENLFYSKNGLPGYFILGIILNLFYNLVFFILNLKVHSKRFQTSVCKDYKYAIEFPNVQNAAFILCENDKIKDEIFRNYQQQENACFLEKINTNDFQFDLNPYKVFKHLCKISRVNETTASERLELLGIEGIDNLKALKKLSHEEILKIYAAIKTSQKCDYIVINDFVKGETRRFEKSFFDLLSFFESSGKKIIYLSCEMYNQSVSLNDRLIIDDYKIFDLPLTTVSLR